MPRPVDISPNLPEISPEPVENLQTRGFSSFCTSTSPLGLGSLTGYISNYSDINAFAFGFVAASKFKLESISLIIYDAQGNKKGAMFQSARQGVLNSRHALAPADCESVGLCLDATVKTLHELNIELRENIQILYNGLPVYLGRLRNSEKINYPDSHRREYSYALGGWKAYAADPYGVEKTYKNVKVLDAVIEQAQHLANETPIKYNANKIELPDYTLTNTVVSGKSLAILNQLQKFATDYQWGIDVYGDFYFKKKRLEPVHHFWLSVHNLKINRLDLNSTQIKNHLILQYKPEQGPTQTRVIEDAASVAQYNKVEQKLNINTTPFTIVQATGLDRTITSNKPIINAVALDTPFDRGNAQYARIDPLALDDYLELTLTNPDPTNVISGLKIYQGSDIWKRNGLPRGEVQHLQVYALPSNDLLADIEQPNGGLYLLSFSENRQGDTGYKIVAKSLPIELLSDWVNDFWVDFYTNSGTETTLGSSTTATIEFTPHYDMKVKSIDWYVQTTAPAPNDTHKIMLNGTEITKQSGGNTGSLVFDFPSVALTAGTTYTITFTRDVNAQWELITDVPTDPEVAALSTGATVAGTTYGANVGITRIVADVNAGKAKGWELRQIEIPISTANDATRYAEEYLKVYGQPYVEGSLKLPADNFLTPATIRLTDYDPISHIFYISRMTYNVNNGLEITAEIGNRQLNLEQLLTQDNS